MALKGTKYSSGHLLLLARRAWERSLTDGSESRVAMIMAAVALEAFVNEVEDVASNKAWGFAASVTNMGSALTSAEEEHASVALRIQIAYLALTGSLPDRGAQPFQDIALLIKLRNLLVHAKPEEVELGEAQDDKQFPKIVRSFASRGVIPHPRPEQPIAWEQYVIVPAVAAWAHDTCSIAMRWLVEASADADFKALFRVQLQHLRQSRET